MEVARITGNVNVAQLVSMKTNSSGRINLPVSRAQAPYSQFEYVKGVATSNSSSTVPIDRLRVLNTLIDGLVSSKQQISEIPESATLKSEGSIDAMIQHYASQLHSSLAAPQTLFTGAAYTVGSLFSLQA